MNTPPNKFIVIELEDIAQYCSEQEVQSLVGIITKINEFRRVDGRDKLGCVVVESNCPEYTKVWEMYNERKTNEKLKE